MTGAMRVVAGGVAASTVLADLLTGPAVRATVRGIGRHAIHLDAGGRSVTLEGPRGAGLPTALRFGPSAWPPRIAGDDRVTLGDRCVDLAGMRLTVRRWWDPTVRLRRFGAAALWTASPVLQAAATSWMGTDALAVTIRRFVRALATDDLGAVAGAATALVGRGPGLTPAGDDVLAGALAALRVLGDAVTDVPTAVATARADAVARAALPVAAERTTTLAADLLVLADRGAVASPVARVLRAVAGTGDLRAAVAVVAQVGHTSGRDLLAGMAGAVSAMCPHDERVSA